ncbi:MAG: TolC family protein [Lachnospiraceae bacterium]|nr:TolC family protein [Lachnospiraceae bacterium]
MLAVPVTVSSFAAGPGQFASLDDETYARLMDNKAEWDEIENLVTYYNPTYRMYADSVDATNDDLSTARDTFRDEMNDSIDLIDKNLETVKKQRDDLSKLPQAMPIDQYGTTAGMAGAQLSAAEDSLKEARTQAKEGLKQGNKMVASTIDKTKKALKPARLQLTKTIETLFISYSQLLINRSLFEKQVSLYETMLGTQNALYSQNMASAADVVSATATLAQARVTLTQVDNGINQLRSAIGIQLGWNIDNPPEIGTVPAPDISFVLTTNKEEDYKKAIEENTAYEEIGKVKNYNGASAVYQRDAVINEANAEYSAKLDSLYAAMQEKKLLYDAAQTSLSIAALSKDKAQRMYNLGLTGKAEYEGMQLQYLSSEAAASLASLSLTQAINDYKWAVKGLM